MERNPVNKINIQQRSPFTIRDDGVWIDLGNKDVHLGPSDEYTPDPNIAKMLTQAIIETRDKKRFSTGKNLHIENDKPQNPS